MHLIQGRAYTVSWLVQIKVSYTYSNPWLVTLHSCFQPASLTPHPAPLQNVTLRSGFNTLDNWGHKTPTQSKKNRNRKERIKGSWPGTYIKYTRLHTHDAGCSHDDGCTHDDDCRAGASRLSAHLGLYSYFVPSSLSLIPNTYVNKLQLSSELIFYWSRINQIHTCFRFCASKHRGWNTIKPFSVTSINMASRWAGGARHWCYQASRAGRTTLQRLNTLTIQLDLKLAHLFKGHNHFHCFGGSMHLIMDTE